MVKFLPGISGDRRRNSGESPPPDTNLHSSSSSSSSLSLQTSLPSIPFPASNTTARHHCSATIRAHSSYVFSLAISGNLLLSASSSGDLRAWDLLHPNNHHSSSSASAPSHSAVKSIAVLHDGHRFFTAHHDHKIRAWKIQTHNINNNKNSKYKRIYFNTIQTHNNITTNKTTTTTNNNKSKTTDLKLITTLPTAWDRWFMNIFSAKNYVEIRRHKKCAWVRHADAVSGLALSPDGLRLYSVSWDRSIKVWRASGGFRCAESVPNAHDDAINAVVCSPDGLVFTGSADKTIKVWKRNDDSNKGRHVPVSMLEGHKSAVNALALNENGSVLYSGGCDRSVIVWERKDNEGGVVMVVAGKLRGHRKAILCLAAVGDLVCSGSADKTVRVWRKLPESGGGSGGYSCLAVLEGHLGPVKCLAASRDFNDDSKNDEGKNDDGKLYRVYSGGLDFDIKVWEIWPPP
ncbi:Transducin/WD40 repeat-like superfamily protein [Striga hermonthica]|uniref:Transducin/WD40 repeat-like superfamily protein n=1 Tax=Striga hermonthica TaxID=68872 RepID=A0A9N7MTE7_STRHE|nr:Transducin/WD40 repeat-like superfamily protein [Striga hermonthica]